jgi:uncharacterized membrane protein YhdT
MRYRLVVPAAYAAILSWLAYTPINVPDSVGLAIWFGLPFVAGLLAGPWAALALPVAVLISVPAGYGNGEAEIPIWVVMAFVSLVALVVIVVASAIRWLVLRDLGRAGAQ